MCLCSIEAVYGTTRRCVHYTIANNQVTLLVHCCCNALIGLKKVFFQVLMLCPSVKLYLISSTRFCSRDCKCENCILILQRQQVQGKLKRLQSSESTSRRGATTRVQLNSTNQKNHPQELHRRLRYQHVPPQQQVDTARHLQYQFRVSETILIALMKRRGVFQIES